MRTLYKGASSGGYATEKNKYGELLYFADPSQSFVLDEVVPHRKQEGDLWVGDLRPPVVHQEWDKFLLSHPEYVTKTHLGFDETGEYEINRYIIDNGSPRDNNNVLIPGRKVRVLLDTIHPELANHAHILELVRAILTQDHIPEVMALRETCIFSCIPTVNPWGLANIKRHNSNGVDINGNFPVGWTLQGEPWDMRHGGTAPLTEVETRILYDEMVRFSPDVHISFHSHGDQDESGAFFWTVPPYGDLINHPIWVSHMRACAAAKKLWPDTRPPRELIELRTPNLSGGRGRAVDTSTSMGAISMNFEAALTLDSNGQKGVKGSEESIRLAVMGAMFFILECIKMMRG